MRYKVIKEHPTYKIYENGKVVNISTNYVIEGSEPLDYHRENHY